MLHYARTTASPVTKDAELGVAPGGGGGRSSASWRTRAPGIPGRNHDALVQSARLAAPVARRGRQLELLLAFYESSALAARIASLPDGPGLQPPPPSAQSDRGRRSGCLAAQRQLGRLPRRGGASAHLRETRNLTLKRPLRAAWPAALVAVTSTLARRFLRASLRGSLSLTFATCLAVSVTDLRATGRLRPLT